MFIIAVLATVIGSLIPVDPATAKILSDQLNQTVTQGTTNGTLIPDIFINNCTLCLLMFIPLVGAGLGLFILYSTGQAFRAVFEIQAASGAATASATNISPTTAILALVLIGVVFLLEYVSYTIAITESVWLFRRLLQNRWKVELKYLLISVGVVTLLLIIGAIVETYTLSIGL
jgi:hypothetical protein